MDNNYPPRDNSVFSKSVHAGRRKYFLDIRTTRNGDHYFTMTERKDGQRHTVHIYKEDFLKFENAFNECKEKIRELIPNFDEVQIEAKPNYQSEAID